MKENQLKILSLLFLLRVGEAFICESVGLYPNPEAIDCSSYYNCSEIGLNGTLERCGDLLGFNPDRKSCVLSTNFECTGDIKDITDEENGDIRPEFPNNIIDMVVQNTTKITTKASNDFECPDVGRYDDVNSEDCTKYYYCTRSIDGKLTLAERKCTLGRVFSPEIRLCFPKILYTCPRNIVSSEILYKCPGVGLYADNSSLDCTKYFACSRNLDLTLKATLSTCPPNTIYNAILRVCVPTTSYTCPLTPMMRIAPEILFSCPDVGKYENEASENCNTFFYCYRNSKQELVYTLQDCPSNTFFDPTRRICVLSLIFTCPKVRSTSSTFFNCPDIGNFADKTSSDCTKFFSCTLDIDLTLKSESLMCPMNTIFDPINRICSLNVTNIKCMN